MNRFLGRTLVALFAASTMLVLVAWGAAASGTPASSMPAPLRVPQDTGTPTFTPTSVPTSTSSTPTATSATSATSTPDPFPNCAPTWSLIDRPTTEQLADVSIVSPREVWAIGAPNALRWLSGTWTVYNVASVLPYPTSISGASSNSVWAAGSSNIAHFDGTSWASSAFPTTTSVPNPTPYHDTPYFNSIRARTPNDAWAVGGFNGQYGSSCVTYKYCYAVIAHWDGASWSLNPAPSSPQTSPALVFDGATLNFAHFDSIAYLGTNETWFVGAVDEWSGSIFQSFPRARHCINTTCASSDPLYAGTRTWLRSISAAAPNDVWAVGTVGLGTGTSLVEHWNGSSWTIVSVPNVGILSSVTAIAPNNIWAVGPSAILHYDGTTWQQVSAPSGANSIASRGPDDLWAVGSTVMHYPDMPRFSDVTSDDPFYRYIQALACRNIVSGYADGTFRPGNPVTRGQQSKMVANAAGFNEPATGQNFQDVEPGSTFYDFIQRLASRDYINGYPCGGPNEPCIDPARLPYFRPNNNVTRGQISKIVSNSAGFNDPPGDQIFEDVPPGSTFYDFIQRLASRHIMSGYPCGGPNEPCITPTDRPYFRSNNNATRGQTSKIVDNTFFP